jgi:hypothetical protein
MNDLRKVLEEELGEPFTIPGGPEMIDPQLEDEYNVDCSCGMRWQTKNGLFAIPEGHVGHTLSF